jgi:hypothetical protein
MRRQAEENLRAKPIRRGHVEIHVVIEIWTHLARTSITKRLSKMEMHMQQLGVRDSPSQMPMPASHVKYHSPYFTPEMVERMSERQRGKLSHTQEEKQRQQACGFIEAVGSKTGL